MNDNINILLNRSFHKYNFDKNNLSPLKPVKKVFKELEILQTNKNKVLEEHDVLGQIVPYSDPKSVYYNPTGEILNKDFYKTQMMMQIKKGIEFCNEYEIPIKKKYMDLNKKNYIIMLEDILNISNICLFKVNKHDITNTLRFVSINNNSNNNSNNKMKLGNLEEWYHNLNKYYTSLKSRTNDELEFIYNLLYNSRIKYLEKKKKYNKISYS